MYRGTPRELLILSLPTLAIGFGLLWLKHRRRRRDTHTDPGGTTANIHNGEIYHLISEKGENRDLVENNLENSNLKSKVSSEIARSSSIIEQSEIEDSEVSDKSGIVVGEVSSSVEATDNYKSTEILLEDSSYKVTSTVEETELETNTEIIEHNKEDSEALNCIKQEADKKLIDEQLMIDESAVELNEEVKLQNTTKNDESELLNISSSSIEGEIVSEFIQLTSKSSIDNKVEEIENIVDKEAEIASPERKGEPAEISTEASFSEEGAQSLELLKEKEENMKKVEQGDLVQKLTNLDLDSMKIEADEKRKESSERDSANHSPSEVMLASPSISNFSDAHSEGSSDSGKGHSDVATSPSRTPAGGSSLAGDLALFLYEFILPQVIVGRLIGRHGAFLHDIRTSTQTNIFIKRHPDTNKLKICAIEGTQQDIDKALAKIRQKFPLRRFPQLTLEKVTFVTINTFPPLKLEDFHLQLVEGLNNDVVLSSLISAAHFFLQQPSHPTYSSLATLNQVMNQVYMTDDAPVLEIPIKDAVCAALTMGGWYRAQIISVDEENSTSTVRFLDYGGYLVVDSSSLRQIRGDLLTLPFQAVECYLANVAPKDEEGWSEEAKLFVQSLTHSQILQAQIYDYAEDSTPLVYLYSSKGTEVVLINEALIVQGYGVLTSSDPEEE